jgi:hypothetical protein
MKQERLAVAVAVGTALTTVVISMVLNTWAFTATLDGWFGHAVGILLPCWVLALTFMGHRAMHLEGCKSLSIGCYTLAGFALVVSMPHLAAGYGQLGLSGWECWSLAIVTDLTQVAGKLLVITVADRSDMKQVRANKPAKPAVVKRQRKQPVLAAA